MPFENELIENKPKTGERMEEKLPPLKTSADIDKATEDHLRNMREGLNAAIGGKSKPCEPQNDERKQDDPAGAPKFHKDSNI